MAKYRKKPVIVEAEQWFKPGDAGISDTMPAKPGQPCMDEYKLPRGA